MMRRVDVHDVLILVRAFYLLAALSIIIVRFIPSLRDRFLDYGARSNTEHARQAANEPSGLVARLLDWTAQVKVPHARFSDFYAFLFLCLAFWASQLSGIGLYGRYLQSGIDLDPCPFESPRTTICFLALTIQSLRRYYECITLSKQSNASMWIGHYLIGLAFYFFITIAVWVEQMQHDEGRCHRKKWLTLRGDFTPFDGAATLLFGLASMLQQHYHRYLFSLKKYTLPDRFAFNYIISPHYTAECLIYVALSFLAAPAGLLVNTTMLCALLFVVVNLAVTADGTKRWMLAKFPDRAQDIQQRHLMIPFIL
jgi:3-oxo-5-alpha-steroid 4-dehydrogenase 3 / polyprenol reductase